MSPMIQKSFSLEEALWLSLWESCRRRRLRGHLAVTVYPLRLRFAQPPLPRGEARDAGKTLGVRISAGFPHPALRVACPYPFCPFGTFPPDRGGNRPRRGRLFTQKRRPFGRRFQVFFICPRRTLRLPCRTPALRRSSGRSWHPRRAFPRRW